MYTKDLFLSIIAHKFVWISVGQHFSFAEIIYPCQKSSHYVGGPPFASHIATHLLWLWTAECWVTLLQWLCQVAGYWQELEQCCICRFPFPTLNGWHVRWFCWPCKNTFSFQELCGDLGNMGPCLTILQQEVMVVDERHKNGCTMQCQ